MWVEDALLSRRKFPSRSWKVFQGHGHDTSPQEGAAALSPWPQVDTRGAGPGETVRPVE